MDISRTLNSFFRFAANTVGYQARKPSVDFGAHLSTREEHQGMFGSRKGYDVTFFADRELHSGKDGEPQWRLMIHLKPITIFYNVAPNDHGYGRNSDPIFDTVTHEFPLICNIPDMYIDTMLKTVNESRDISMLGQNMMSKHSFVGLNIDENVTLAFALLEHTSPSELQGVGRVSERYFGSDASP